MPFVVEFAKSKVHKIGEEHVVPWHVYSNPFIPFKHPLLSLSCYLLKFTYCFKTNAFFLSCNSQYERYSNIFLTLMKENEHKLKLLSIQMGDLSTPPCRKVVANMVSDGYNLLPPLISVLIWAGWVMVGFKDEYLKYEASGYQYAGCCASGLDQMSKYFSLSPPHFEYTNLGEI